MYTIERYESYRIVEDSEAASGPGLFARIGRLAMDPAVHRDLDGPMTHRDGTVWVIALGDDDQAVGVACIHVHELESKGRAWFDNAYVRPDHRGHGLHGRLFAHRMAIAQRMGVTTVRGLARPTARLAFEAHGFAVVSERGQYRTYERRMDDGKPL